MSHYHAEIVIPPTDDIDEAISKVLNPFDENSENENVYRKHAFWDWWKIGGRWSGEKLMAEFGTEELESFHKKLVDAKVTVSCVTAGKQTLSPPSQIELVDQMWRDSFPGKGDVCPLFDHYKGGNVDICKVGKCPDKLSCYRLIVANRELKAQVMLASQIWNGVTWQDTAFDGKVKPVLDAAVAGEKYPYASELMKVTADWLVVTVDYHS